MKHKMCNQCYGSGRVHCPKCGGTGRLEVFEQEGTRVSPWSDEELDGIARENVPDWEALSVEEMGRVLQGIRIGSRNPDPDTEKK